MSSSGIVLIYILIVCLYLCLNGLLASNASNIAKEKGYEKDKWFHMCFWLGPVAYIIVAAMPDKVLRENQEQTNTLLKKMLENFSATPEKQEQDVKEDVSSYLPEL